MDQCLRGRSDLHMGDQTWIIGQCATLWMLPSCVFFSPHRDKWDCLPELTTKPPEKHWKPQARTRKPVAPKRRLGKLIWCSRTVHPTKSGQKTPNLWGAAELGKTGPRGACNPVSCSQQGVFQPSHRQKHVASGYGVSGWLDMIYAPYLPLSECLSF